MTFGFQQVIAQQGVKEHLLQMVRENQLPHALMFCGPQGAGKLPLALGFARYLLCTEPSCIDACGQCTGCRMLDNWAHPDLHFSFPIYKAKSSDHPVSDNFLEAWRKQLLENPYFDTEMWLNDIKAENQQITFYVQESDALQRKLALKSSQGGRKVVLMWLPEKMSQEVANKLLKLIEEPPLHTYFLLISEEPEMVLGTIQSRVQRINVPSLTEKEIANALMTLHAVPEELALNIAHISRGNYTEALKRLEAGNEQQQFFSLFIQLMRSSYIRDLKDLQAWTQSVKELGRERQKRMIDYFQRLLRENFIYNFHNVEMNYMTKEEQQFSTRFAPYINEKNVIGIMEELSDAGRDIEQNVNAQMVFFDFALKMIILLKK
ncbi:MAG: DNA polymerase III subunit delta [Bacteroidaceae bacterium]|nr:DNA polymerase III subunit delta [Bacteroidaceae bacterium]